MTRMESTFDTDCSAHFLFPTTVAEKLTNVLAAVLKFFPASCNGFFFCASHNNSGGHFQILQLTLSTRVCLNDRSFICHCVELLTHHPGNEHSVMSWKTNTVLHSVTRHHRYISFTYFAHYNVEYILQSTVTKVTECVTGQCRQFEALGRTNMRH